MSPGQIAGTRTMFVRGGGEKDGTMARVEIYTSLLCGYCYRAKKLLEAKGIDYEEIDVMLRPGSRAEMIERSGGRNSVPQIFVDGAHIGDCDDIYALEAAGKLTSLVEDAS